MQLEFGGRRYAVAAADIIIGSGPDSTVQLSAPGVLPRHAVVRPLGDGMAVIVPAAPEALILVNGTRLGRDPTPLMHGDKIGIGGQDLTVADPRRAGATRVISAVPAQPGSPAPTVAATPTPSGISGRLVSMSDGREYALEAARLAIGRDATCAVVVEEEAVSRRHAEILRTSEGDWLTDQSGNGTYINGERVRGKTLLSGGDVIRVGATELRYYRVERPRQAPPRPPLPVPAAPPLAALLVRSGQLKGQRLAVRTPVANIGRAEYNDLKLADSSISASHAKLQLREGIWMLSDLGSTNGSQVDGEAVVGEMPLSPGTTITLGEVRLFFEPLDGGTRRAGGTQVIGIRDAVEAAVVAAAPPPRRQPAPPAARPLRRTLLIIGLLLGTLFLVGYLFLG